MRKHGGATPYQDPWPPRSPLYGKPVIMYDHNQHEIELDNESISTQDKSQEDELIGEDDLVLEGLDPNGRLAHLDLPSSLQV